MKKKILKYSLLAVFICIILGFFYNAYIWNVSGNQYIKIVTSKKIYTNSDMYVSIKALTKSQTQTLDTKTKVKLLDKNGKKVKKSKVSYDDDNIIINVPEVEEGKYFIEAKIKTKQGKDKVKKEIYIENGNDENINITLDKGIYKPRRYSEF